MPVQNSNCSRNEVEISVIIPLYNEGKIIFQNVLLIADYLKKHFNSYEIILVDDGSTDDTLNVIKDIQECNKNIFIIQNQKNKGKGYSIRRGFAEAKGELILFTDADLSTPIEELGKLISKMAEGFDITIASRALPDSKIILHQSRTRENMGIGFGFIARTLTGLKIRDTQCGFKLFPKKIVNIIFPDLTINGFSFDVELLVIAKEKGFKIAEVPIVWKNSNKTAVNIYTAPIEMLFDLIRIKWNLLHKNYLHK